MVVRLSALRAGRPLPPGRYLVLTSVRGLVDARAIVRLEGLGQLKNKIHLIGTRTRNLLACSIGPQPTTLPRDRWLSFLMRNNFQCETVCGIKMITEDGDDPFSIYQETANTHHRRWAASERTLSSSLNTRSDTNTKGRERNQHNSMK
jgi:hypothetical protein